MLGGGICGCLVVGGRLEIEGSLPKDGVGGLTSRLLMAKERGTSRKNENILLVKELCDDDIIVSN